MTNSLPDLLPAAVLKRRSRLTPKPEPVVLSGQFARLEPFDFLRHLEALHAVSNGRPITMGSRSISAYDAEALIWRYMSAGPFESLEPFREFVNKQANASNGLPYCVIDVQAGQPIGMANYMNNTPEHLRIELGNIWYSPIAQRTCANTEATYLMLARAFELGYRRVEWKCDARNERSRRAALRMGFRFEGIQENHMIIKGRSRDTAWFRILDSDWPDVKSHLEKLLSRTDKNEN